MLATFFRSSCGPKRAQFLHTGTTFDMAVHARCIVDASGLAGERRDRSTSQNRRKMAPAKLLSEEVADINS
jgi:hypothetical protein